MLKAFSLGFHGLLFFGALGCAAEVAPTDTCAHKPVPTAEPTAEGLSFTVMLPRDITAETVIPAIVAAGHAELAAGCEGTPGAMIRILNPLAPDAFALVSCSSVLGGFDTTSAASAMFINDGRDGSIGTVQQKWSPFGLGCTLAVGAAALVATYALCPRATNPQDEKYCGYVTNGGFTGLGVMCAFI